MQKAGQEQEKRHNEWLNILLDYGFKNVSFPVAVINETHKSVTIISTLEDYAFDPDLYFWPVTTDATLIDSNGMQYRLKYQGKLQFSYPDEKIAELDLGKVKQLLRQRIRKKKLVPIIESSNTIKELYHGLH